MDKLKLINEVLSEIGDNVVSNLNDTKDIEAIHYNNLWDGAYDENLSLYAWNFTKKFVELTPINEEVIRGYEHVYLVPDDRLGELVSAEYKGSGYVGGVGGYLGGGVRQNKEHLIVQGNRVYSNYNPLFIQYTGYVKYEDTPAYFRQLVKVAFKIKVCQRNMGSVPNIYANELAVIEQAAKDQNRKTAPSEDLSATGLITARLSGSGGFYYGGR